MSVWWATKSKCHEQDLVLQKHCLPQAHTWSEGQWVIAQRTDINMNSVSLGFSSGLVAQQCGSAELKCPVYCLDPLWMLQ